MQSLELESSLVAALGNLIVGLAVFFQKPRSRAHQAFGLLSLAMVVWNAADFAYGVARWKDPAAVPGWHRVVFAGSMAIPPAALFLVRELTGRRRDWTWWYAWALLLQFIVMMALLSTPLFPHPYQMVAAAYQFSNLALCLCLLVVRLRRARGLEQLQLKYLLVGGLLATALGATDYFAVHYPVPRLGALAVLLYLCLVAGAIGRHGLFSASRIFGRWVLVLVVAFAIAALSQIVQAFRPGGLVSEVLSPLLVAIFAVALYDPLREALRLYRGRAHQASQGLADGMAAVGRSLVFTAEPERWKETLLAGLRALPGVLGVEYAAHPGEGAHPGNSAHPGEGSRPAPAVAGMGAVFLETLERIRGSPRLDEPWLARATRAESPNLDGRGAESRDLGSAIFLPVQDREHLYGAVILWMEKPHLVLETEHLDLLTLVGTQAGLLCQAAERLRWMKRQEELTALAEMAAGLAHEIKNPLGTIRGAVDLLQEDPGDQADRFLGMIREEVDALDRIVTGFLRFGKPGQLEREKLDLAVLAREARDAVAVRPEFPRIEFESPSALYVRGDHARLKEVLLNLLLNAGQAAGANGRLDLKLERDQRAILLRVRDTGAGIPAEVLPRLFRPFFTTRHDGTGLGLAICARIVDLHGGSISAGNWKGDGEGGAEFVVRLPSWSPE